jgi:transcriptional regulator with XRE-family HTH domain
LAESNPTLARRELAVIFRNIREQRKRTLDEVARELGVSVPQASRLDTGARGYRPQDVERLCDWYGLPESERVRLLALAEESRKRGWWQQVDLPDSYRTLIGLEQGAEAINEYNSNVVSGLLQTRPYATAVAAGSGLDITPDRAALAADIRVRRQEILSRVPPPQLWVVLDEAALARTTGGRAVMREQLERVHAAARRPHITVQVIAFDYGIHPGTENNFILLELGDTMPGVVYTEGLPEPRDSSLPSDLRQYRLIWDALRAIALDPPASLRRIEHYINRLRR